MEEMARRDGGSDRNSTPAPLGMHHHSHTISKVKPKIRIIHIFAPEIIKTDVENFRELVQRLTGKPSAGDRKGYCRKNNKAIEVVVGGKKKKTAETRETRIIKGEEHVWGGENSGGFLSGFGDLDGFMQEFGEFPLLPLPLDVSATHSHTHGFEEAQLS